MEGKGLFSRSGAYDLSRRIDEVLPTQYTKWTQVDVSHLVHRKRWILKSVSNHIILKCKGWHPNRETSWVLL